MIGSLIFIWTIVADLLQFLNEKKIKVFLPTILAFGITVLVFLIEHKIEHDFEKPTLIKVFHDGDINGSGFDFKKDGTYIFDNSSIGLSSYIYGTYTINDNQITLDRKHLERVIVSERLEIMNRTRISSSDTTTEKYLFQMDEQGSVIEKACDFRVIIDNRK